jgi:hypothetical protein
MIGHLLDFVLGNDGVDTPHAPWVRHSLLLACLNGDDHSHSSPMASTVGQQRRT